ncbi:F-box protein PP2-A12 isoform X2 [Carica papaya]|uniref:F-box protein PP2-A12 isoform X2 n=1 Tax=Carica papaya TaxID=3649 RepID=UPI000B8C83B3|nr:F-box protein PP2-A12 isoform X2 [Carica papaya]
MGANLSALFTDPNFLSSSYPSSSSYCLSSSSSSSSRTGLGDLPESCVALIIGNLDPPDICKLAKLNRAFRGASWADFVWKTKLPSNYHILIQKLFGDFPRQLDKREIYTMLCRVNSIDGGTKQVWLDKRTGGVCLSISSKGLLITGIDDRRYWNHIPTEESRLGGQIQTSGAFLPKYCRVLYHCISPADLVV